jgi:ribosomal protein S18 acetylase RimI-like enzyme
MTTDTDPSLRKATPGDSRALAELMNMAGEGLPAHLWAEMAGPGEDVMEVGARRVARAEGSFSYANAEVLTVGGTLAGMLLAYRLPDPYETGPLEELPAVVRGLVELEALAPGSFYVNAVATTPAHRGQGIGSRLMQLAEARARESGARTLSLIVAEDNAGARRLYERLGYATAARRPITSYPGCKHTGDWILMTKALGESKA